MNRTNRWGILVGAALTVAWGVGCGSTQRTGPNELVILIEASVEDLDPRFAASAYAIKVSRLVAAPAPGSGLARMPLLKTPAAMIPMPCASQ